jgi:hypothetical protein
MHIVARQTHPPNIQYIRTKDRKAMRLSTAKMILFLSLIAAALEGTVDVVVAMVVKGGSDGESDGEEVASLFSWEVAVVICVVAACEVGL